jgi:hypothetical protein
VIFDEIFVLNSRIFFFKKLFGRNEDSSNGDQEADVAVVVRVVQLAVEWELVAEVLVRKQLQKEERNKNSNFKALVNKTTKSLH